MEHDQEDSTEVNIKFLGKMLNIKGVGAIFIMVLGIMASGLGWMLYDLAHSSAQAVKESLAMQSQTSIEHKAIMDAAVSIKENQGVIMDGVKRVESSVKVQNWILLADPAEKAEIKQKMNMPKELREMGVRERN